MKKWYFIINYLTFIRKAFHLKKRSNFKISKQYDLLFKNTKTKKHHKSKLKHIGTI